MVHAHLTSYYHKSKDKHLKCHSIPAIAIELEATRPAIVTAILEVTVKQGSIARDRIMVAYDALKSDSRSHRMILQALLAYFWATHKKSALRDQIRSIIQDYALAKNQEEVDSLLTACGQGHTMNFVCPLTMTEVDMLPRVTRLTLDAHNDRAEFDEVVKHWLGLFHCIASFIL
jgi:hypothetical protein